MSLADDLKKQTNDFRTKKIDYQVDTLGADNKSTLGGYHIHATNTITMNYHEDNKRLLNWEKDSHDAILYHEQKHRSNANKGFKSKNIGISPEQYYKLCMADEISANMATLVYLREEYIKTGDINVFEKDGKRFSFYKEAVQKGDVNPLSSDPKNFEKDMSLIMNGTQKMWMKKFADKYSKNHINMTEGYLRYRKCNFKKNEAEYQKQLDIAYTIGGVNFKQYMKEDVKVPDNWRTNQILPKFKYIEKVEDFPFQGNMSFEQYNNLLQHLYIANGIKEYTDEVLKHYNAKNIKDLNDEQRKIYFNNIKVGVERGKLMLSDPDYQETLKTKELINSQMNKALGQDGERALLPNENKENYQAALKQIYNINGVDCYSLLKINPQEKMPIEKTKEVKEFEERNLFKRCTDKMGRWGDQIRDKVANLFKKKEEKAPEPKDSKDYLSNYPTWSKDKRVSEIQYEEILDLDKPVITGIPGAQRSQSIPSKTADEATRSTKEASKSVKTNMDKAAYLRSLSGRTQQATTRVSPSFNQMRDNKNNMELMLLRRQMGR